MHLQVLRKFFTHPKTPLKYQLADYQTHPHYTNFRKSPHTLPRSQYLYKSTGSSRTFSLIYNLCITVKTERIINHGIRLTVYFPNHRLHQLFQFNRCQHALKNTEVYPHSMPTQQSGNTVSPFVVGHIISYDIKSLLHIQPPTILQHTV